MYDFISQILYIFAVIGALISLLLLFKSMYTVQQKQAVIIERLGKYHRTLFPGLNFIIPFIDSPRIVIWTKSEADNGKFYSKTEYLTRIDLRETVDDFPKQNVITKDNVTIEINALLYYQIFDPKAAVYEVFNLPEAIEKLTQTTLRNVIGHLDLDETLVSRDQVNERLRIILDDATDKWGVKVNRVELQEVKPPADIRQAMEKQMRAERDRRAIILEAEGKKRAAILEAEGIQESQILKAKGEAESQALRAEGEATACLKIAHAESQAIGLIKQVAPDKDPFSYIIAMQYIKMVPEMTKGKDGKMIIVPYEASSLIGSLAPIKELFAGK